MYEAKKSEQKTPVPARTMNDSGLGSSASKESTISDCGWGEWNEDLQGLPVAVICRTFDCTTAKDLASVPPVHME